MAAACPSPYSIVGTFLCGQKTVSSYKQDALCGIPVCGYATCGMFWATLCAAQLQLSGIPPDGVLVGVDSVPAAQLSLSALAPALLITSTLTVPAAQLQLGGVAPGFKISSIISPPAAELALGAEAAIVVRQVWLYDEVCTDLPLDPAGATDLVLVPAGVTTFDLDPEECL